MLPYLTALTQLATALVLLFKTLAEKKGDKKKDSKRSRRFKSRKQR